MKSFKVTFKGVIKNIINIKASNKSEVKKEIRECCLDKLSIKKSKNIGDYVVLVVIISKVKGGLYLFPAGYNSRITRVLVCTLYQQATPLDNQRHLSGRSP